MTEVVAAIDLGTSSIKAALVAEDGAWIAHADADAPPLDGTEMSFDAEAYLAAAVRALRECVRRAADVDVVGLCPTAQRASCALIGDDGRACAPVRSWQGTSCGAAASRFYDRFGVDRFRASTGLLPSAIYTIATLAHLIEEHALPETARIGVVADYVIARLGGDRFVTDPSNASATGMMEVRARAWSPAILDALGVPVDRLPEIRPSGSRVGALSAEAARDIGLPAGLPLVLGGGDQQCAVLGAGASRPGECVLSLGTSAAVLCPTDAPPAPDAHGLLFTSHVVPGQWVVEGFISSFGSAQRWASSVLGSPDEDELDALARGSGLPCGEIVFVPFLAGIGSPDFDDRSRAAFFGMTLSHSRADLARSVLEGLAFETRRVLAAFERHTAVHRLLTIGGGSRSPLLTRTLADITGRALRVSPTPDAALLGAAVLGWVGAGRFADVASATNVISGNDALEVVPAGDAEAAARRFERYLARVRAVRELEDR